MFKESIKPQNSIEKEEPEVFYEQQLGNLDNLKQLEYETLSSLEKKITAEKDLEKRTNKSNKLTVFVLGSLIAFGITRESIQNRALAQNIPEKETRQVLNRINIEELENQRLIDVQRIENIFQEEKIEEKITFLKDYYAEAIQGFLSIRKISRTLDFLKIAKQGIRQNDPDVLVKKDFPLAMTPGSIISSLAKENWTVLNKEQKLEKSKDIKINGFESVAGFSNEDVETYLKSKYSPQWFRGSTKEIVFVPEIRKIDERYEKAGETKSYGISAMIEKDERAPLAVYEISQGHTRESVLETIDHELAHNNDWQNSMILSNQERINLFYGVTQRYNEEDRFKSNYIESIKIEDKSLERYVKTKEYWAKIVENYMTDKDKFEKSFPKDANLVKKWFNIINDIK